MRREWNHSEIEILRQNYASKTIAEMRELLPNRSSKAINHEASRLNIPKSAYFWTQQECEVLRENWANNSQPKLLALLPLKDWSSIRHKAFELGLAKKAFAKYWRTYDKVQPIILSEAEKGYLAGIIDGEGTLRVMRSLKKWYAPFIQITNTNEALMEWLQQLLGTQGYGRIYHDKCRKLPNHKTKFVYNIASVQGVKQILDQIAPLLVIKKEQAKLLLEFIAMKEEKADYGVLPREKEIFEELTKLNRRGVIVAE
jgi:hypothetical protein